MMRRLMTFTVALFVLAGAAQAEAHERFRIVGTVTRITATEIEVKTVKDKTMIADVDKKTIFTRDKKKIPAATVKIGSSVVVDALGDDEFDLTAQEVRLVPPVKPAPAK